MTGLGEDLPHGTGAIWRRTLPVWLALTVLLAATVFGAYLPLGRFNLVLSLAIAVVKAALVVLFFMQLRRPDPLLRLAAFAALVFMTFMFILAFADVLTRAAPTQPGTVMPRDRAPDMSSVIMRDRSGCGPVGGRCSHPTRLR